VELSTIVKRLSGVEEVRDQLFATDVHRTLCYLLHTKDAAILQCSLLSLANLSHSSYYLTAMRSIAYVDQLLLILQDYENTFKELASDLLLLLSTEDHYRLEIKMFSGVGVLLRLLQTDSMNLLHLVLHILGNIAANSSCAREIVNTGGVSVILQVLSTAYEQDSPVDIPIWVCTALALISLDHDACIQIRLKNGVYLLGRVLVEERWMHVSGNVWGDFDVRSFALRTLRCLYTVERNRSIFKRLFPPAFFAAFIDCGGYNMNLKSYVPLVDILDGLSAQSLIHLRKHLEDINLMRPTSDRRIEGYSVEDKIGAGAFGSVFQVRKILAGGGVSDFLYAMKELPITTEESSESSDDEATDSKYNNVAKKVNPVSAKASAGVSKEIDILSRLNHPNIVQYYESFVANDHLYIVMELVEEGTTLADALNVVKEKGSFVPEDRLWFIFIQLVQALHHMHKEVLVVHRDLTPSNIMLDIKDKVKITDFGLASQRHSSGSVMESVVGTVMYSCPELLTSRRYTEKADIWALGCILYQMATLSPPFIGSNPLSVTMRIVEGFPDPIPPNLYSGLLYRVSSQLLCKDPDSRPDILDVAGLIAPLLLKTVDASQLQMLRLEGALLYERRAREREVILAERKLDAVQKVDSNRVRTALPTPSGSTLSISSRRLRAVKDPLSELLNQVYKLVYVDQQPPPTERDVRRTAVRMYKRALFTSAPGSYFKAELNKLMNCSPEAVDMDWPPQLLEREGVITYERLHFILEEVLVSTGYYDKMRSTTAVTRVVRAQSTPVSLEP